MYRGEIGHYAVRRADRSSVCGIAHKMRCDEAMLLEMNVAGSFMRKLWLMRWNSMML